MQLGFSHDIIFELPENIEIKVDRTELIIEGIDKQLVGSVAAKKYDLLENLNRIREKVLDIKMNL